MKIRVRAPQGQFLLERILANVEGVTVEVRGFDLDTLDLLARRVSAALGDVAGITDVELSREAGIPQQEIHVDRAKISDLGLSVRDVTEVIETAVAGSKAGEYRVQGNSYRILVQLEDAEKRSLDEILDLTLRTPGGELVVLRNLVSSEAGQGPVTIERKDQQRLVTVTANVAERDLGSVAKDIQARLDRIPRPLGYDLLIAGDFEEQQKAFDELLISLLLALLLVYMVLASQYESLGDPLVVMLSVPLAAIGVILTLFLTETTLNLQSAIGCIMLGGIVVNNAILLVDQAGQSAPGRPGHRRGPGGSGPAPPAPGADDHPDHHPGPAAAGLRHRRGGRRPGPAGPRRGRRADGLHPDHPGADPGGLFVVSPASAWTHPGGAAAGRGWAVTRGSRGLPNIGGICPGSRDFNPPDSDPGGALFRISNVIPVNRFRRETMPRKANPPPLRNPVAKHAARLQRAATFRDRSKYQRHSKHKGRESFPLPIAVSR